METKPETGTLAWFDFPTKDATKAQAFFKKVFGWEFTPMGPDYQMIKVGNNTIGGLRTEKKWTAGESMINYFTVPSCKEGRDVVKKAGGSLVGETIAINDGKSGHFQLFKDLDGNMMSLWSIKP